MDTSTPALIGQLVDGRYRVEQFIARGGMATVFKATDERLDRTVALKVMHPGLAEDEDFVARFVREARAAARLSNPAIVAVYDQGEADGVVYLAMEFVPGCNLRDILTKYGRLDSATSLGIMEQVLEALDAAHRAGFVHRDIKPENVLIADDGRVKVADFGLARAISTSNKSGLTQGLLIGTVAYLAPEQVERGAADARTDVYSAGIVLYECLVGQTPFTGETPMSIAYQHVHAQVPQASSIRSDIPQSVDELVAIATRQDPAARYADASDFVQHLRTVRATLGANEVAPANTIVLDRQEATVTVGPWGGAGAGAAIATAYAPQPPAQGPPPWVPPPMPPADITTAKLPKKPRKKRVLIALLVLVLIAGIAGGGAWYWAQSQIVKVPSVIGMTATQAQQALSPSNINLAVDGQDYSETVPKGAIVTMTPEAGSELAKGQTVNVRTSAGPEMVKIPDVVGKPTKRATAMLTAAKLTSKFTEEYNSSVDAGLVVSMTPAAGKNVRVGTAVSFVVSKGPPPVTVPNVIANGKDDAVQKLQALGLNVVVRNQLPLVVVGRVYNQNPSPGTVVAAGSTVTITLV